MQTQKIVILGAGFGGLAAAFELGRKIKNGALRDAEVTLIDRNKYHTYTPTLYESAATSKDTADYISLKSIVTMPVADMLQGLTIKFVQDEVIQLDIGRDASVHLKSGYIVRYDYLIIALGSVTNYFGIPGLEENALEIKTFADSMKVRDAIWGEMTSREATEPLKVVVGGGGVTGVELAAELQLWLKQLGRHHSKRGVSVKIVEANPSILNGFDARVVKGAEKRLKKIGVEVLTGKTITSVEEGPAKKIKTRAGDEVPFDILIWAGGVTANKLLRSAPMKMLGGRAEVGEGMVCVLQTPDLSFAQKIYAVGDIVCVMDKKTDRPVPLVARAAITQAKIAACNIEREINSKPHKIYHPMDYPYIIAVGGKYAICKIGPIVTKGFFAWVLKGLVELNYLWGIMPKFKALRIWIKGFFIFIKNERLG